jgi:hypothetical protein
MKGDRPRRPVRHLTHDAVAMLLTVGERQEDLEGNRCER